MTSFHPLRCDVIGPICRYVPFHTERELKTAFCFQKMALFSAGSNSINRSRAFFCHGAKENTICLRREANSDHWIRRRTFSLCTSRPRHFNVLFRVLFSYKRFVLTSMRSLTQLNVPLVFIFSIQFGLLKKVKATFLCPILRIRLYS